MLVLLSCLKIFSGLIDSFLITLKSSPVLVMMSSWDEKALMEKKRREKPFSKWEFKTLWSKSCETLWDNLFRVRFCWWEKKTIKIIFNNWVLSHINLYARQQYSHLIPAEVLWGVSSYHSHFTEGITTEAGKQQRWRESEGESPALDGKTQSWKKHEVMML